MKKVLLVNYGYYPAIKYGGPVVSVNNFCNLFKDDIKTFLITCDHEIDSKLRLDGISDGWNRVGNCNVLYLPDNQIVYRNLKRIISKLNPDVIYLQSMFEAKFLIPVLYIGNKANIRTIVAPRGDICKGAMERKYFMKRMYLFAIRALHLTDNVIFHSTSEEESKMISKLLRVDYKKMFEIENIPSICNDDIEFPSKVPNELKLVYIGRIVPKKNVLMAIELVGKAGAGISLDIYGSIEDENYWEKCINLMNQYPQNQISYCGSLQHEEVVDTFLKYDAFLFPTKSENYGHTIVESLQSGCPVIISDQTPWQNLSASNAGWNIPLYCVDKYIKVINILRVMEKDEYKKIREAAKKYIMDHIDYSSLKNNYIDLIGGLK